MEIRIGKERKRILWGSDKVLFLDPGGGYIDIFTFNKLSSGMCKIYAPFCGRSKGRIKLIWQDLLLPNSC